MPETDLDGGMASAENLRRILGRTPVIVETASGELGSRSRSAPA